VYAGLSSTKTSAPRECSTAFPQDRRGNSLVRFNPRKAPYPADRSAHSEVGGLVERRPERSPYDRQFQTVLCVIYLLMEPASGSNAIELVSPGPNSPSQRYSEALS
jgi:hypothetical protein